jgi:hypothetical protein
MVRSKDMEQIVARDEYDTYRALAAAVVASNDSSSTDEREAGRVTNETPAMTEGARRLRHKLRELVDTLPH